MVHILKLVLIGRVFFQTLREEQLLLLKNDQELGKEYEGHRQALQLIQVKHTYLDKKEQAKREKTHKISGRTSECCGQKSNNRPGEQHFE